MTAAKSAAGSKAAAAVSAVSRIVAWPLVGLVWFYRYAVSPLLGVHCRFQPSCSAYAMQALSEYGLIRGGWLSLRRIARCHPWGGSGQDPLPQGDKEH